MVDFPYSEIRHPGPVFQGNYLTFNLKFPPLGGSFKWSDRKRKGRKNKIGAWVACKDDYEISSKVVKVPSGQKTLDSSY